MRRFALVLAALAAVVVVQALVAEEAEKVSWGDLKSGFGKDALPAAKKLGKVDVCHYQGDSDLFSVINISGNAVDKHFENHGDSFPGDYFADADGDGYGDPDGATDVCPNAGFVDNGLDCQDADAGVNPGVDEVCGDGIDNNCDGQVDEDCVPDNCAVAECGGHSYAICQGQQTKSQSAASCADIGMSLAFIDDLAENTCVVDAALAAFGYVNFEETSYWIANTKDDSPIDPWAIGEPNSSSDRDIHILRYIGQPYKWNDASGIAWTWGWVCESAD